MASRIVRNDDDKARDDDARKRDDAAAGEKLDKLLTGLDSVMSACDDMRKRIDDAHKRMDAMEADDKKRDDTRKDDDRRDDARRDDAKHFSHRKDDDDDKKYADRHDSEEKELSERLEKEGETKEKAADRARRARKDAEETEEKERQAAADKKRDDDAKMRDDDARRRDDDAKKRDDAHKRDDSGSVLSAEIAKALKELNALRGELPKPLNAADRAAFADAQERAQNVFAAWGEDAPYPLLNETLPGYRVRLLGKMQKHSQNWKDVDLGKIAFADSTVIDAAETQIYADAMVASNNRTDLPRGQLVPVQKRDQAGRVITEFKGNGTFVRRFSRPARRAVFNMQNLNSSRNR